MNNGFHDILLLLYREPKRESCSHIDSIKTTSLRPKSVSPRSMNVCPVRLKTNSMYTQVGNLVLTKTSISKERSILKLSGLGLLAHSVRLLSFRAGFKIREIAISVVHQPGVKSSRKSSLEKFSSFKT